MKGSMSTSSVQNAGSLPFLPILIPTAQESSSLGNFPSPGWLITNNAMPFLQLVTERLEHKANWGIPFMRRDRKQSTEYCEQCLSFQKFHYGDGFRLSRDGPTLFALSCCGAAYKWGIVQTLSWLLTSLSSFHNPPTCIVLFCVIWNLVPFSAKPSTLNERCPFAVGLKKPLHLIAR
jgi:hypothetical protein